jgi:8-oxo-dGTP pyrophosphatase MutT (NUDIX family)
MSEETWKVLGSEVALRHPFLTVTMEQVLLPDGRVIEDWPIVDARDFVMVVAQNEAGEILVLEGYKHGAGRVSWQVVGGYLEEGEDAAVAARRELLEEGGLCTDEWVSLGAFVVDGNRRNNVAHLFLAKRTYNGEAVPSDDLEVARQMWITVEEAREALRDGRVCIVSTAVALALAMPHLETGNSTAGQVVTQPAVHLNTLETPRS